MIMAMLMLAFQFLMEIHFTFLLFHFLLSKIIFIFQISLSQRKVVKLLYHVIVKAFIKKNPRHFI